MRIIALMTMVICFFGSSNAMAGLDDELKLIFSNMVTTGTAPGYTETQRRGVLSGGSFAYRDKIVKPNLIAFQPPNIGGLQGGSCNGVNFYGGAISFIKKDQLVAFLRSIASNAAGYVFSLALSSACSKCAEWINKWQKTVDWLNNSMKDSCQAAKSLVGLAGLKEGEPIEGLDMSDSWLGQRISSATPDLQSDNMWDALFPEDKSKSASSEVKDTAKHKYDSNPVWEAIKDQDVKSFFSSSDVDTVNALHSMIGPVVIFWETKPPKTAPELSIEPMEPTVSFKDLYFGNPVLETWGCTLGSSDTVTNSWNESSTDYLGNSDDCLKDHSASATPVAHGGMRTYVESIFMGGGNYGGETSPGLVSKFRNPLSTGLTDAELKFIDRTRLPVAAILRNMAINGIYMPNLVDALIDYTAVDMLRQWVEEAVSATKQAVGASDVEGKDVVYAQLNKRLLELNKEATEIQKEIKAQSSFFQLVQATLGTTWGEKLPITVAVENANSDSLPK